MKTIVNIIVIAAIVYFGYILWLQRHREVAPPITKAPVIQEEVVPPTPSLPRLAPKNIYFLVSRASITSDSGIVGFSPGTKVTLLSESPSGLLVSDGEHKFTVTRSQVTNDLDKANQIIMGYQSGLAINAKANEEAAQLYYEQQQKKLIDQSQPRTTSQVAAGPAASTYVSPLSKGAYNQKRSVRDQFYTDSEGRVHRYHRTASGGSIED